MVASSDPMRAYEHSSQNEVNDMLLFTVQKSHRFRE